MVKRTARALANAIVKKAKTHKRAMTKKKAGLSKKAKRQVKAIARKAADTDPVAKRLPLSRTIARVPFQTNNRGITEMVMMYCDSETQYGILTSGWTGTYSFGEIWNSGFHPYYPAGGHQPRGWDQAVAAGGYVSYRVMKIKVVYKFYVAAEPYNASTPASYNNIRVPFVAMAQLCNRNGANNYDAFNVNGQAYPYDLIEQGSAKRADLKVKTGVSEGKPVTIVITADPKKVYGHQYEDETGWTAVGSNPSSLTYSVVARATANTLGGGGLAGTQFGITCTYKAYYTIQFRQDNTTSSS